LNKGCTLMSHDPYRERNGITTAALALFFCHYNFCRFHKSLKRMTPAMAHGISTEVWSVRKMIERVTGIE
jgi:hypothetical protein